MTSESTLTVQPSRSLVLPKIPTHWANKHLLGLEHLSADEISLILDFAEALHAVTNHGRTKPCFMDEGQTVGFEISKTGEEKDLQKVPKGSLAIRYAFPYFVKKPVDGTAGPKGYVKGIFTMDDQVFKTL